MLTRTRPCTGSYSGLCVPDPRGSHAVSQRRERRKEGSDGVPEDFKDGFAVGSNLLNV